MAEKISYLEKLINDLEEHYDDLNIKPVGFFNGRINDEDIDYWDEYDWYTGLMFYMPPELSLTHVNGSSFYIPYPHRYIMFALSDQDKYCELAKVFYTLRKEKSFSKFETSIGSFLPNNEGENFCIGDYNAPSNLGAYDSILGYMNRYYSSEYNNDYLVDAFFRPSTYMMLDNLAVEGGKTIRDTILKLNHNQLYSYHLDSFLPDLLNALQTKPKFWSRKNYLKDFPSHLQHRVGSQDPFGIAERNKEYVMSKPIYKKEDFFKQARKILTQ